MSQNFNAYLVLFKNKNFSLMALNELLASYGFSVLYITLSWVLYARTGQVSTLAIYMFFALIPGIILGPIAGFVGDTLNRKYTICFVDTVRGVLLIVFVLIFRDMWSVHDIFILGFLLGIFRTFYEPAAIPLIKEIIPNKKQLSLANTTLRIIFETGFVVGLGSSGWLLHLLGILNTFIIAGVTFLIGGIIILFLQYPHRVSVKKPKSTYWFLNVFVSMYQNYRDAFQYIKTYPFLLSLFFIYSIVMVVFLSMTVLVVPFVKQYLHGDETTFANLEMFYSVGFVVGGVLLPYWESRLKFIFILFIFSLVLIGAFIGFSIATYTPISYGFYAIIGVGFILIPLTLTALQRYARTSIQGKMQSFVNMVSNLMTLVVYLLIYVSPHIITIQNLYWLEAVLIGGILLLIGFNRHMLYRL